MPARAQSWASVALALLAALAVVAGLILTGGPAEGRREHRDQTRLDDLRRMDTQVHCLAGEADNRLPATIGTTEACPQPVRLEDPFTHAAYRYEVIDARSFRLCAGFEKPRTDAQDWAWSEIDPKTGCMVTHLPEPLPLEDTPATPRAGGAPAAAPAASAPEAMPAPAVPAPG